MLNDYRKFELFGKSLLQKLVLKPPFQFDFPIDERACFLFVKEGDFQYKMDEEQTSIPANYGLFQLQKE